MNVRSLTRRIAAAVASSALLAGGLVAVTATPAQAVPNFTNKTTANGLGSNSVYGVYVVGSTVYAATDGGLSISVNGGATFTNRTTANGLGSNFVRGVYAVGSTIYAATEGGLSISTNGGANFTTYTTANGLGSNNVHGVFSAGSTIYAATLIADEGDGGLSISSSGGETQFGPADEIQQIGQPAAGCENVSLPLLDWAGVSSGGWAPSWAEWVNGGRGGPVCTRTLAYSTSRNAWFVRP